MSKSIPSKYRLSLILLIGTLLLILGYVTLQGEDNSITEKEAVEREDLPELEQDLDVNPSNILAYELNPREQELQFHWKDNTGKAYGNIARLKEALEAEQMELVFAMNGGMFLKDLSPQGLYIEKGTLHQELDTRKEAYGNFYLQPNGVFYLTHDAKAFIKRTSQFQLSENIHYATQSGPMLVIEGSLHSAFNEGSKNVHIRNGVGVLPSGNLLFAMSKEKINFYDFATFFKEKGCKHALYLDGFVSRAYLPEKKWEQVDGTYGIIIAHSKDKK